MCKYFIFIDFGYVSDIDVGDMALLDMIEKSLAQIAEPHPFEELVSIFLHFPAMVFQQTFNGPYIYLVEPGNLGLCEPKTTLE